MSPQPRSGQPRSPRRWSPRRRPLDDRAVAELAAQIRTAAPSAGRTSVLCVDGRSGAGKTTLAARLADRAGAAVLHLEDIYPGWDGLAAGVALLVSAVLEPLARGEPAAVPQWDWHARRPASPLLLQPPRRLIVEGVGAASAPARQHATLAIWLELPAAERYSRALARDGAAYQPRWASWAAQEELLIAREGLPGAADLILDVPPGR